MRRRLRGRLSCSGGLRAPCASAWRCRPASHELLSRRRSRSRRRRRSRSGQHLHVRAVAQEDALQRAIAAVAHCVLPTCRVPRLHHARERGRALASAAGVAWPRRHLHAAADREQRLVVRQRGVAARAAAVQRALGRARGRLLAFGRPQVRRALDASGIAAPPSQGRVRPRPRPVMHQGRRAGRALGNSRSSQGGLWRNEPAARYSSSSSFVMHSTAEAHGGTADQHQRVRPVEVLHQA